MGLRSAPNPRAEALYAMRWRVPGVGLVRVRLARAVHAATIDEDWPPLRRSTDENQGWSWGEIIRKSLERFVIVDASEHPIGAFAGRRSSLVQFHVDRCYRPDRLEIHPGYRGGPLGGFLFGVLCLRAKTLGASGVLLASLPGASRFYLSLGGERATGWNVAHGLHPFIFREHVLTQITETLDDLLEEDE